MLFDWNREKARKNLADHKVSFQEAATVFGNPLSDTFDDPDHSIDERRFSSSVIRKMADFFSFRIQTTVKR